MRWTRLLPYAAMAALCAQSVARTSLWKAAEPRVMAIAREQFEAGLLRSLTFSGMPFLEKPPLYYDLTAIAFHAAGGPSILAARVVVALLAAVCLTGVVLVARRAAGRDAGLLAGLLFAVSPAFTALARRLGVDVALVAALTVSLWLLYAAVTEGRERLHGRWFAAALVAAGCAALSKGVFGTFLFLAPTIAYALVARDRRVLRALIRPSSLALLALPHVLWGLVLFRSGGVTYVFEHFVNNTVGRALHLRFDVGGALDLPYGDVGGTYDWWYYLRFIPTSALPAILAVPFALAAQRRRGGLRAGDPLSRLVALCLCWGVIPPILLSFSSYKGRGHLAASSAALTVIGAVWLARRLASVERATTSRVAHAVTLTLYVAAPLLAIAGFRGLPATQQAVGGAFAASALLLLVGATAALRARRADLAVHTLVAALAVGYVIDFSPGNLGESNAHNSMDEVSQWVAHEADAAEGLPVAVFYPDHRPSHDFIGWARENEVGTLTFWLGRPVTRLRTPRAVRSYLESDRPGYFVAHREKDHPLAWPAAEPGAGWIAVGGNARDEFVLVANRAAAALHPAPAFTPPNVAAPGAAH